MENYLEILAEKFLAMFSNFVKAAPRITIGIVLALVFWLISKLIKKAVYSTLSRFSQLESVALLFSRLASIAFVSLGTLIAAGVVFPSITPANILSLLGIGGVAIGFAFKDIFQNFLAGILILVLRFFRIGDQIEVEGVEGTVEDIRIRATFIRTYDNRRIIIPNATIFSSKIIVNTAYDKRRVSAFVGIGYGDDIGTAKKVILDTLRQIEGVLQDPKPYVLVIGYGASTVDLEIRFWQQPPLRIDFLEMRDAVLEAVKPALVNAGIDLPFPTQQILFHDQTEETDGDRNAQREGWPGTPSAPRPRWIAKNLADSRRPEGVQQERESRL